jgi:hypothetical protein
MGLVQALQGRRRGVSLVVATVSLLFVSSAVAPASEAAAPRGFWYGTDSSTIAVSTGAPYRTPVIGGPYGGT